MRKIFENEEELNVEEAYQNKLNIYKKKFFSYINIAVFAMLVVLGCCLVVFLATKAHYSKQDQIIVQKDSGFIREERTISGETIKSDMEDIGKLCTAEYSYTHVEHVDDSKKIKGFKIPFTTSTFTYSYDGSIKAGIDFTKIQVDKDDTEKRITVTLPEVEIISSEVDQNSFQLYDEKNSIFNPIAVTDVTDSFTALKESEEKKAIEKGLFEQAKENAVAVVKNFMRSYGVEDYQIDVL